MAESDPAARAWKKSSYSPDSGACVEVLVEAEHVRVRDSTDPRGGELVFSHAEWRSFIAGLRFVQHQAGEPGG